MIYESIRALCMLSVLFGAGMSMMPQGAVKRVAEIVCASALILALLGPLTEADLDSFAVDKAKLHQREQTLLSSSKQSKEALDRLVIEEGYETYIRDKASQLGMMGLEVEVLAKWSMEGLWIPWQAELSGLAGEEQKKSLETMMLTELGIPAERQLWKDG